MAYSRYTPAQQLTYGRPQYERAEQDWQRIYGDYSSLMRGVKPGLKQMMQYYAPGGGYGAGQREEAQEAVRGGQARDYASMVSSGMSSQFGARGVGTRAGAELSKLYKNIEDTRSQLWQQSTQPYAQMMSQAANIMQARPAYRQYFQPGAKIPTSLTKIW